jgi:sugar lactone lactonase YvrE
MARLQTSHTLDPSIPTHRIVDAARGTDGRWYLLDETDATILVLDDMMQPLHKWGDGELIRPTSIVPDQSTSDFLVLDRGQQAVIRINSDGHTTDRITSDSIPGGLMNPTGLAVATNGELFLTDAGHHVVHRLAPDGTHLGSWGQRGSDHEEFWKPAGIVVDDQNRVIVLDHGNHRCQVFEPDGTWLMTFGAGRSYTPQNRPPASPDSD